MGLQCGHAKSTSFHQCIISEEKVPGVNGRQKHSSMGCEVCGVTDSLGINC